MPAALPDGEREYLPASQGPLCAPSRGEGAAFVPIFAGLLAEVEAGEEPEGGRDQLPPPAGQGGPGSGCWRLPPRRRFRRGLAGQEWHPVAGDSITGVLPLAPSPGCGEGPAASAARAWFRGERDIAGLEVGLQPRTPSLGKDL